MYTLFVKLAPVPQQPAGVPVELAVLDGEFLQTSLCHVAVSANDLWGFPRLGLASGLCGPQMAKPTMVGDSDLY